ncbi:TetR/AcrR family transcriptional regulator [Frankia umida]|uniref:TetR/AcrR family transcriptional regulator n=1 Tax=Frankia umida TaxID=573489 RepID=UPI00200F0CFB|nr:TetR family transcriptional regulator [Frankia umida]
MTSNTPTARRSERRLVTHAAILDAARSLFREGGYQRTTIRAIGREAGVDPALVIQHFGNKEALFEAASEIDFDLAEALPGPRDELSARVLEYMLTQLDKEPDALLATLRSMLTHQQAAHAARCAFLDDGATKISGVLDGEDAGLRSSLICTMLVGLMVTRHLLKLDDIVQAPTERLIELVEPCLRSLVEPERRLSDHG